MTDQLKEIVVYTHPDCEGCDLVLYDLDREGVAYRQIDITLHPDAIPGLLKHTNGERVTPVIVDGDKVFIGYRGIGCVF